MVLSLLNIGRDVKLCRKARYLAVAYMGSVHPDIIGAVHSLEAQNGFVLHPLRGDLKVSFVDSRRVFCRNIGRIQREEVKHVRVVHVVVSL